MTYAELATATNFSFLRGASHPEELVAQAAGLGHAGIGVADRNSVAGVVRAHVYARERREDIGEFKVVAGARLVFEDDTPDIIAYPQDRAAWGRLCRMLTQANMRAEKGKSLLRLDDLIEYADGQLLIVMERSSHDASPFPGKPARDDALARLRAAAKGRLWLALTAVYGPRMRRDFARRLTLARETGLPLVAVNDVLMHTPERRELADVLTCIRKGRTLDDAGRLLSLNAERHLKSPREMARLFSEAPEAVAESVRILDRIGFSLDELAHNYPSELREGFPSEQAALEHYVAEGAKARWPNGVPAQAAATIAHELKIVAVLGYAAYFLTVHDIVRYARSEGILAQGRGSAANSAICYCLGITEIDPVGAGLLFERFISQQRNEPPDIDVDFEHERREEVIQHIYERYGRDRAALTATVVSYRGRSAIRETAKVFGFSEDVLSALSGSVWGRGEAPGAQAGARAGLDPSEPRLARTLTLAHEIAGFPRHLSQHTGGFVITRDRLDEIVPIMPATMDDRTTIEWDKDDLEALRILKVDVLALGMLTALRKSFALLDRHYGRKLALADLRTDEPPVYGMISAADTIGVFQIESRAQMSMLPRLKPQKFYDLVIEVAIVRPGPIQGDMVHPYLRRRLGLEPTTYPKEELREVLEKTRGVPLFQEQAMRIAIVAAGFTPDEADRLRRAMATFKRVGTIGHFRAKMIEGMTARGYPREFAERCFKQIEGFGSYGFPESHAASFALLVYASAWMKCYYPDVFACALINAQPMGFYAPAQIVRDAREHGVDVREPDINASDWDCTLEPVLRRHAPQTPISHAEEPAQQASRSMIQRLVSRPPFETRLSGAPQGEGSSQDEKGGNLIPGSAARQRVSNGEVSTSRAVHPRHAERAEHIRTTHALRLGFRLISGLAEDDMKKLVALRGRGYDSVRDVWLRTGLSTRALELLAGADAFASLGLTRRDALWAVQGLNRAGDKDDLPLLRPLSFRATEPDADLPPMPPGEEVIEDYRRLRLSLRAHPVSFVRRDLDARGAMRNGDLVNARRDRVKVSGLVLVRQRPGTASGVVFMTLEDETGVANVIVWPKLFEKLRATVIGARFVAVTGKYQNASGVIHIIAEHIDDLTPLLSQIAGAAGAIDASARAGEAPRPRAPREKPAAPDLFGGETAAMRDALPKGRNFQ
ncbi:MAG: error-prone DNA polymerase [Rhodoblastus sp.]